MARSKLLLALMFGMMLTGCGGEDAPEISPELSPAPLPIETQAPLTELSYEGALLPLDELCDVVLNSTEFPAMSKTEMTEMLDMIMDFSKYGIKTTKGEMMSNSFYKNMCLTHEEIEKLIKKLEV